MTTAKKMPLSTLNLKSLSRILWVRPLWYHLLMGSAIESGLTNPEPNRQAYANGVVRLGRVDV